MPGGATGRSADGWGALRREMLAAGCPHDLVAREIERRGDLRPREAHRLARGWSRRELADRATAVGAQIAAAPCCPQWTATSPGGRPAVGAAWVGQVERWPRGGLRPCPHALTVLAAVLGTTIGRLLDYDDHRNLTDAERAEIVQLVQWQAG